MKNTLIAISLAAAASSGILAVASCASTTKALPAGITLAECVADAALKREPIAQIAIDCAADVPAVIAALVNSKNPEVASSVAYGEARRTLSISLPQDAGK